MDFLWLFHTQIAHFHCNSFHLISGENSFDSLTQVEHHSMNPSFRIWLGEKLKYHIKKLRLRYSWSNFLRTRQYYVVGLTFLSKCQFTDPKNVFPLFPIRKCLMAWAQMSLYPDRKANWPRYFPLWPETSYRSQVAGHKSYSGQTCQFHRSRPYYGSECSQ